MLMPARSTVDEMLVNPAAERRLATKLAGHGVGRGDVYRSSETGWAAVGSLAVGIVFAVVAASGGRGAVVAGVGAVLLLLVAWRMSIAGIQVRRDGVRVGTAFSSKSVSWQDIDHFAVLPLGRFPYVGHVVLRDGRTLATFGLSTNARRSDSNRLRIQRTIDQLNRLLVARRQS